MSAVSTAVGVDMVDCARFARLMEADATFVSMSFTPEERETCGSSVERLAARWAAKEATMKALGRGIGRIAPIDIEIRNDEFGAPHLELSASALRRAHEVGCSNWSVSLSHERGAAVAFVVMVRGGQDG